MEHDIEPVRGLPGQLPPGERILWQGAPATLTLARTAFHTRGVAIYFAVLAAIALGLALSRGGGFFGVLATAGVGIAGVGLLHLLAWATARSAVYTLTDRRIVLRVGVALPKCINLPLARIESVDVAAGADGCGDIALRLAGAAPLGWMLLWPHARPWRLARPEPTLRAVPDGARIAALLARTCLAAQPAAQPEARVAAPAPAAAPAHAFPEAVAA